jgi:hypothetical protein
MLRKLNYTGRKRIALSDVTISLDPLGPGRHAFIADLRLERYRLPRRARIFVEAWKHANRMRFDFGTVGIPVHPPAHELELTEFAGTNNMLFRVKVVDFETELGKLLAEADQIRPRLAEETGAEREALLHVRKDDLGQRLWRSEIPDADSEIMPCIIVNTKLDKADFTRSAEFRALVLPAVFEQVLMRLPLPAETESGTWAMRWWTFLIRLGCGSPASEDERPDWMEDALDRFCERNNLIKAYLGQHAGDSFSE